MIQLTYLQASCYNLNQWKLTYHPIACYYLKQFWLRSWILMASLSHNELNTIPHQIPEPVGINLYHTILWLEILLPALNWNSITIINYMAMWCHQTTWDSDIVHLCYLLIRGSTLCDVVKPLIHIVLVSFNKEILVIDSIASYLDNISFFYSLSIGICYKNVSQIGTVLYVCCHWLPPFWWNAHVKTKLSESYSGIIVTV